MNVPPTQPTDDRRVESARIVLEECFWGDYRLTAEQFVGQQLLYGKKGYAEPELYYWQPPKSETQAEVDFLFPFENHIYPVEVKSGQGGTIKSLLSYVVRKKADQAVVISSAMPSVEQLTAKVNKAQRPFRLLRIPFYLVNQLER